MAEERLADKLEAMDAEILGWAKLTRTKLMLSLISIGVADKIKLAKTVSRIRSKKGGGFQKEEFLTKSLSKYLRKKNGDIEAVGFSFAQHGIFIERGVGRGRPVGSTRAAAQKRPWIDNTLPAEVDALANLLEEKYADIAAAELKIVIPGIITKVR